MSTFAFVGNWDRYKAPPGNGFGIFRYDPRSGTLELIKNVFPEISVGATCLHPRRDILYCTDECTTLPGNYLGGGGQVYALAIDAGSGDLSEINHRPSHGSLPSSVVVDASGTFLIVTHHTDRTPVTKVREDGRGGYRIALEYDDATTVLFPLRDDGSIGEPCDVFKHTGDGGPLARQTHPQLHSVTMSPSGALFAVCDKGNDEIVLFRIDRGSRKLERCGGFRSIPGSSPRYIAFHPTQPYLFLNHETVGVVTSLRYQEDGSLEPVCTVSALPDGSKDDPSMHQSDIKVHPSGKSLYSMVRGINAISAFSVEGKTGELVRMQTLMLDATGPRGFAIAEDGRYMVAAALGSREVLVLDIGADGLLSPPSGKLAQPNPGSVTFFPAPRRIT